MDHREREVGAPKGRFNSPAATTTTNSTTTTVSAADLVQQSINFFDITHNEALGTLNRRITTESVKFPEKPIYNETIVPLLKKPALRARHGCLVRSTRHLLMPALSTLPSRRFLTRGASPPSSPRSPARVTRRSSLVPTRTASTSSSPPSSLLQAPTTTAAAPSRSSKPYAYSSSRKRSWRARRTTQSSSTGTQLRRAVC
jgi:hypothetical protein